MPDDLRLLSRGHKAEAMASLVRYARAKQCFPGKTAGGHELQPVGAIWWPVEYGAM